MLIGNYSKTEGITDFVLALRGIPSQLASVLSKFIVLFKLIEALLGKEVLWLNSNNATDRLG